MNVGELVIYSEGGKDYNALVLGQRVINEPVRIDGRAVVISHEGKNGEPLLSLVFAKARLDAFGVELPLHGTGHQNELVQIRLDVAHDSQEYSEAEQKALGKKQYDGGRWREFAPSQSAVAEAQE